MSAIGMADDAQKRKQYDDWRNVAFVEAKAREAASRRKDLWEAMNKFVIQCGAWVVSVPNAKTLRIKTRRDSNLASKLAELGYSPRQCGVNARFISGSFAPRCH
jgi:hypothetical protein